MRVLGFGGRLATVGYVDGAGARLRARPAAGVQQRAHRSRHRSRFPFDELPAAKAYMESNAQVGKIVIRVA